MQPKPDRGEFSFGNAVVDTQPLTAAGQTRLAKVMALMTAHPEASCILAIYRQKVSGIATRSDLLNVLATRSDWVTMKLSQVMTRNVVTVSATAPKPLLALLEQLQQHDISHLPVVDEQARLVGLIAKSQLLQALHRQTVAAQSPQQAPQQAPQQVQFSQHSRRTQLLAEITLKIRQSLQLKEILQTTVDEVKRLLNADRVLIYQVFPDGTGKTISEAVASPYPSILDMSFPEEVFPEAYQALYAQGRVQAIANVHAPDAGMSECLVEFVEAWKVHAKLIVPIVQPMNPSADSVSLSKQLWGLLIAHQCSQPREWSEFELDLMQQLAGQISLALSQGLLLAYLEDRVVLRTAELTEANIALQREIKERQLVDAALQQSEAQLRLITNNLPVLIAYVDHRQRYQFNNQVYAHWLGQRPEDIVGKSIESVMDKAHYGKIREHVAAARAGEAVSYESELAFQGGQAHAVNVTYIPHIERTEDRKKNKKNKLEVKGFFALTTDISDRKAIERMKDEFIAVVSHELRTPLTSIHTSLKLLATGRLGELSDDGQQMLEVADDNTDRLVRLVNNVLDLQRIDAGEVTMDRMAYDAAKLLEQSADAMQALAQQHGIEIQIQSMPISIWVDPDYIIRTLTNLIGNAIKFSPSGNLIRLTVEPYIKSQPVEPHIKSQKASPKEPHVKTTFKAISNKVTSNKATSKIPSTSNKQALFCVQDDGQGIPSHKLAAIFERFQQVDSSDSREKGGTGLGLTICRKIVEQHGGRIWAESQFGQGSRFYFTVPLSRELI